MAYSDKDDVASEFKGIVFDATSAVTDTEVTDFITQSDAEIDGLIGNRYVTPITGTISLITMKQISIWLTAFRIAEILEVKTKSEENSTAGAKTLREMALDLLDKISKGEFQLVDAILASAGGGWKSYADDNDLCAAFKKDTDQW